MKIRDTIMAGIAGLIIGIFWSFIIISASFQKTAIENGHAHYNPGTTKFEWNTNCYNNVK